MNMSKRVFWDIFWSVWQQIFIEKNIASIFKKTDIWSCDSDVVLNKIIKKKILEKNTDDLQAFKTFMIERAVRRIQKVYEKQSIRAFLFKIFIVNERFAVNESINQHVIRDLLNALKDEKKRRKRDKKLNLLNEHHFESQFFSSKKMQATKVYQTAKDEKKSRK